MASRAGKLHFRPHSAPGAVGFHVLPPPLESCCIYSAPGVLLCILRPWSGPYFLALLRPGSGMFTITHISAPGAAAFTILVTDLLLTGTLRSGKEFSPHGAIILDDFDVLQHVHVARAKNNVAENASDDHPISVPSRRERICPRSRSESPRRSVRLALPVNNSIDRSGRTRAAHRANEQTRLGTPLKRVVRKHLANAQPINIDTSPDDYPVTSTGSGGIRDTKPPVEPREYTIPELVESFGMSVVPWDGCSPRPLVDREKRVIAVLGGRPNDDNYLHLTQDAAEEIESTRAELRFRPDQQGGRHGAFSSVGVGISFGGGQQVPGNLAVSPATSILFQRLFALECFFRIAGFANGLSLFHAWNPAVHLYYVSMLDTLTNADPELRRNFVRRFSAFAAATINFGPSTVTLPHIDALNLVWGWCAITALGIFNPDLGGHLVLWDL
ncbi:hypothetical protein MVEN_00269400 [Mycena venus]|uniref:Uncharacterized protein n=1 Tax=Mycena venus TaxID=2733690 RepID=A0A8H6Z1W6_9AGAR|nr:hypothetical protein MVEN_00269400 [Mycena venus]